MKLKSFSFICWIMCALGVLASFIFQVMSIYLERGVAGDLFWWAVASATLAIFFAILMPAGGAKT